MSSFESPKRMSEEEAHDEANILQAEVREQKIRQSRKNGAPESRETTAADYDNALAKLEELKRAIDEEPSQEKVLRRVAGLMQMPGYVMIQAAPYMEGFFGKLEVLISRLSKNPISEEDAKDYFESQKEYARKAFREAVDELFSEEENKLRRMKAAGNQFGEGEGKE